MKRTSHGSSGLCRCHGWPCRLQALVIGDIWLETMPAHAPLFSCVSRGTWTVRRGGTNAANEAHGAPAAARRRPAWLLDETVYPLRPVEQRATPWGPQPLARCSVSTPLSFINIVRRNRLQVRLEETRYPLTLIVRRLSEASRRPVRSPLSSATSFDRRSSR